MRSTLHWIGFASLVSGTVVLVLHLYDRRHEPNPSDVPTPAAAQALPKPAPSAGESRAPRHRAINIQSAIDEKATDEVRCWKQLNDLREWLWSLGLYPGRSKTLHDYRLLGDRSDPVIREADPKSDPRFRRHAQAKMEPIVPSPDRP